MPSILIDTIPIAQHKVGVRVYLRQLLEAIPAGDRGNIRLLCVQSNAHLYRDLENYQISVVPWSVSNRVTRAIVQQLAVPFATQRFGADVVFEPVDHAAILTPAPVVTSIHSGPINLHSDQFQGVREWYNRIMLPLSIQRSRCLIAISEFVARRMVDLYGVASEQIDVVHHGGGLVERAQRNGWSPPGIEDRDGDILFVSSLHPHKNADSLIRAYTRLRDQVQDAPALAVVGKDVNGRAIQLRKLTRDLGVADHVRFEGRVSDDRLLHLLKTSRLMVYPSSLEGFGLPAVEAMKAGIPLVASNRASVPEIVGDGGITVDPNDYEALASAMAEALTSPERQKELAEAGRKRGEAFSWEQTARQTLQVLERAAA
ncbi:alpha-1,3-rhamnosyl/mannosyltransferase [Salinibacter ruber]|uniref:glycosyltransferase family 4 protein n=1 Tax=Salinibacter ruber TaxID=146919 RepID=UPI0021675F9C|nr:glycosyltransferase family 1 protein [Salinibacter ruber]MCS3955379.1 alpha-1,3-rhamnosyl/mannosyltransferase [Salinibacter ruber]